VIEHLPGLRPDTARSARTIARCHDTLDRRRAGRRAAARYVAERNALLGFGAIYLSSLAFAIVRVLTS
jgi:hypothetical protein